MMRVLFGLCAFVAPAVCFAALVTSPATEIDELYAYADYGDGDSIVIMADATVGCEAGFWIPKSAPGADIVFSTLLAAKLAGNQIRVRADDAATWPGSSGNYCRIYNVRVL